MHSVEEARAAVLATGHLVGDEEVSVADAHGRILREDQYAAQDVPPWPTSAMDGFAVRVSDLLRLRIVEESAAGAPRMEHVSIGEAAPISTGAWLPPGADAVVPIEAVALDGDHVLLSATPRSGQFVRERASELVAGERLLRTGDELGAAGVALLAAQGRARVRVARKPRVAILSMGRELRPLGEALAAGQLYDANGPALAALCHEAGAVVTMLPLVGDDQSALAATLAAVNADLVLTSGGASVGKHDHLRGAIARARGDVLLWRVAMKPGKPMVLAKLGDRPLVGLPGNPVSAMVSFLLFVRPLLRRMLGAEPAFDAANVHATLVAPLTVAGDRRTFLRARISPVGAELRADLAARQGSAALISMQGANGLVEVPAGDHHYDSGAVLPAWLFAPLAVRS